LDGFPIRLIDTAGLRETPDGIEQMGMDKTREQLAKADLILYLTDPDTINTDPLLAGYLADPRVLPVLNKTDLLGITDLTDWQAALQEKLPISDNSLLKTLIPLSTLSAETLIPLQTAILQRIALPDTSFTSALVTNTRHLAAIQNCLASLDKALASIEQSAGYEFIAFDLIEAVSHLSEITGAVTTDAMLERIFSSFCIGK